MTPATLFLVVLANQGYWFSGQEQALTVRPALAGELPDGAVVLWELKAGPQTLARGQAPFRPDPRAAAKAPGSSAPSASVTIKVPDVRVPVELTWSYRVAPGNAPALQAGQVALHVFPADVAPGLAERAGRARVAVVDRGDSLARALGAAGVRAQRVDSLVRLQLDRPQVVFVAAGQFDASPFSQGPLLDLVNAGSSVMVFAQSKPQRLAGFVLSRRRAPEKLQWKADHPLFRGLGEAALRSWLAGLEDDVFAIALPADAPVLELAAWPREAPGDAPAPSAALLAVQAAGAGRLVLCQMPLEGWDADPRSRILLANAVDYLLTPPEPTPRPSERGERIRNGQPAPPGVTVPTIRVGQ